MVMTDENREVPCETVLETSEIYSGMVIHVRLDTVQLSDGTVTKREIVQHRGAVCIVPITDDRRIVMVRQFRLAAGENLLEIPAGTLEEGENPDDCAARELEEETGLRAAKLTALFSAYLAPGYSTELIHSYLATGLTTADNKLCQDSDERVLTELVCLDDFLDQVKSGGIRDCKSIAAVLTALTYL